MAYRTRDVLFPGFTPVSSANPATASLVCSFPTVSMVLASWLPTLGLALDVSREQVFLLAAYIDHDLRIYQEPSLLLTVSIDSTHGSARQTTPRTVRGDWQGALTSIHRLERLRRLPLREHVFCLRLDEHWMKQVALHRISE